VRVFNVFLRFGLKYRQLDGRAPSLPSARTLAGRRFKRGRAERPPAV
jgi:hypothetical protein